MKLHELIAVQKAVKARVQQLLTELYRKVQSVGLFQGEERTYHPLEESGEQLPSETTRVQNTVTGVISDFRRVLSEIVDLTVSQEEGNTSARANVIYDGITIFEKAPVGALLFLEKKIEDVRTFIRDLPELDPAQSWTLDNNTGLYVSQETVKNRSLKVPKPIVLYPATDKHPAQTQMINEETTVGIYKGRKFSGGIPGTQKRRLLERADKMYAAVKMARQRANEEPVTHSKIADALLSAIFDEKSP
jgi:hypothetical protein